jgi:hypothetical protein
MYGRPIRSKYVMTTIRVAKLLVEAFGELIRATRQTNTGAIGLDLTAETRLQRCDSCALPNVVAPDCLLRLARPTSALSC